MDIIKLNPPLNLKGLLEELNIDLAGLKIMSKKGEVHIFFFPSLSCGAANILKQDALSVGAELAVEKGVPNCTISQTRAVLLATVRQLERLVAKERVQPFGLKEVADKLHQFLITSQVGSESIKLMGVINLNGDSFYQYSRFQGKKAVAAIEKMIEEGADIIDIGGVSSRPGSRYPGEEVELKRVAPVLEQIYRHRLYEQVQFSLDTFSPKVLAYGLERGVTIGNDITGGENWEYLQLIARYNATLVIMHKKGNPETMQLNPFYKNVLLEVDHFFEERIERAKSAGVKKIVLDVGIGFGKRLKDNLILIRHLAHFRRFGYPLLLGVSRKSLIDKAVQWAGLEGVPPEERLPGTLLLHWEGLKNGATIIRCHDIKPHRQMIAVWNAFNAFSPI